jgi:hypothetical protein
MIVLKHRTPKLTCHRGWNNLQIYQNQRVHRPNEMKSILFLGVYLLTIANINALADTAVRTLPKPLPSHPGNIFLAGEEVVLPIPTNEIGAWRLLDYDGKELGKPVAQEGKLDLGCLSVGFYSVHAESPTRWISCAVLEPLKSPTPYDSPVGIDVAMSWFFPTNEMDAVANLCTLAGVNRVRDRLSWQQMEPQRGKWLPPNQYDYAAEAQAHTGLQVLQVNHTSPQWASLVSKRFPLDLRDAYYFYREVAHRWRGEVTAFEPWNEADASNFGGYTGAEMAAFQKAAYLGLKAGNPDVTASLNPFGLHNRIQINDLDANEAWPYFDTFDFHHYVPFDEYPTIYSRFRAATEGRPLWITECAWPVKWTGDDKLKEPDDADLRMQAERLTKTFVSSLYEGSAATFYFMLPHYAEGQTQFGLLRPDLTPRPAYVALAAVGRLLADAKPLGRLTAVTEAVRGFVFSAKPDGQDREVLVVWSTTNGTSMALPAGCEEVLDHLGRIKTESDQLTLSSAPIFVVLPKGSARRLVLQPPPQLPVFRQEKPSPVVMQTIWPQNQVSLAYSAYQLSSEKTETVPLFIYNFSDNPVSGTLKVEVPESWQANSFEPLQLEPQSRHELKLQLNCRPASVAQLANTVRVSGDFGAAGKTLLSLRVMPVPVPLMKPPGKPIKDAEVAHLWHKNITGDGVMKISEQDGGVTFEADMKNSDKWMYPIFALGPQQLCPSNAIGLGLTLTLLEGRAEFRGMFDEPNGISYLADSLNVPKQGEPVETAVMFETATMGVGSKPDPNHLLEPGRIVSLKFGCNSQTERVRFMIKNVRWIMPEAPSVSRYRSQ